MTGDRYSVSSVRKEGCEWRVAATGDQYLVCNTASYFIIIEQKKKDMNGDRRSVSSV